MKNLKQYITILGIILLILIIIILIISFTQNENSEKYHVADISGDIPTEVQILNNYTTYYSIEKMMHNFYSYLEVNNKTAVYSLLDNEYINDNDIELENVINKLSIEGEIDFEYKIKEIYVKQDLYYPIYFIRINIKHSNMVLYYMFYMDNSNGTYAVKPISEQEYNIQIQGKNNKQLEARKIQKNDYNKILQRSLEQEEIVQRYFEDYLYNALYDIEEAYESIDKEYCERKFGNIEQYKKYIYNKREQLVSMDKDSIKNIEDFQTEEEYTNYIYNLDIKELKKYKINRYGDYTQYICVDSYDNYYIFNATASFQYNIILDTYTLPLSDFVGEYNNLEENKKVLLNIERILKSIKDGDYKFAYNKLNESFKTTNFATQADFEKYIKTKYNIDDKITFKSYEKVNDVSIYKIELTDKNGKKKTDAQIVMQLKEGTDFEMSFSKSE